MASLLFGLVPAVPAAAAPAAWPAIWAPYTMADGTPIRDVGGDNNPSHSDIWSGAPSGLGALPTTYLASDGTNIFFRLRLAANPETSQGGSFQSGVWLVQIAVDGVHVASVGLDGKPAGINDEVYASNAAGTVLSSVYGPVVPSGGASGGGRVVADGAGGYFIDYQLPISAITAVAPTVTPSAPVQLFFGTSQNTNNINKDWMLGSSVSFVGLAVVALDGSPPADTSTEVAITSPSSTADPTPSISGTGEVGAAVTVTVDGQSVTATVGPDGTWSVAIPASLADGTHTVTATATDAAGNTATVTQDLLVDASTAVAITSPALTQSSLPIVSGTGEPGASIELVVDGQTLTTAVATDGTWLVTISVPLADGTHSITVTATDALGNTATATQALTVDTLTSIAVTSSPLTNDATPVVAGVAEPGAAIEVLIDGQTMTTTADGSGNWSVTVPVALSDGTYPATVTATDSLGNDATTTQNLTVDTVTSIAVTSSPTTNDPTPTIGGTGEPGSTITVEVDGQTLTGIVDGTGNWSITVPVALTDGTHAVIVTATDLAGNTATTTQNLTLDTSTSVAITSVPFTNDATPAVSGTGEPGATIAVTVAGQSLTTTVAPDGTWSVTVPVALADGTHAVSVTATDALGFTATATQDLAVDSTTTVTIASLGSTDNPTPIINGVGEPGATITLVVDGQTLTGTVDGAGSWSITVPVALNDGPYTVSVTATDLAGNSATDSEPLVIDTQTFAAITSAPLTTDPTPTITGTGEAGATVEVVVDGQTLSATVSPTGTWSVTVPVALADGTHAVTVTATDALGNVASTTQNLTVDSSTTVAITSAASTTDATPVIIGTGEPGSTVTVTVDGQTLTATVANDGTWSVAVPVALADATYTVTATAVDLAGNTATTTQNLLVDATTFVRITSPPLSADPTPTITGLTEPNADIEVMVGTETLTTTADSLGNWSVTVTIPLTDGSYLVPVTASVTDGSGNTATTAQNLTIDTVTTVTISSAAATTDPTPAVSGSGEPGSTVTVVIDGQTLTATVDGNGSWSVTVHAALGDGTYPLSVSATDIVGNTATTNQNLTVDTRTFAAVSTPPLTNDATPTIVGTGEPGAIITVVIGGQIMTATVAPDGTWSVTVPVALADATYPVTVTATDILGNTATTIQNLTVDSITTVAITSPTSTENRTPTISGTGEPGSTITVLVDGQTLTATVAGGGAWSVGVPVGLADGTHAVTVTATDLAGNTATATQDLSVDTQTFVAIVSAPLTNDTTPTITGTGEPGATITMTVGGQPLTTTVAPDGTWSVTVPVALADATYPVTVTATDILGNTATTIQNLTVDSITTVAITSPTATDNPTPSISGTGEPGATITVVVDGQTLTATVDGSGSWSVTVPVALADGTHPVSVTSTDLAGNTATTTQNLTIDTSTTVAITSPSTSGDPTPVIGGTGEPGASVTVTVGGQTVTTTVAADGTWSVTVPTALADGTHPVSITATDSLGNTATTAQNLTIDTTTAVAITTPTTTNDATPTIGGTGEPGASVTVTVGGQTLTTTVAADGTWSVTVPTALADGTHLVAVAATDGQGNTATTAQDLTIDTTTTVILTTPTLSNDPTPMIGGLGSPGDSITVTVGGQTVTTTVGADGTWSVTVPAALADGTHLVSVTATDGLGNIATTSQNLTIDTTLDVAVSGSTIGNDPTPTISGTGEPGSTVTVVVGGEILTTTVGPDGTWSIIVTDPLPDGSHNAQITIVDPAGNSSTVTHTFTIDTVTEVTTITPPLGNDPTPTISGTGEPGSTVTVIVGDQTLTTDVGPDGTWSVTVTDPLPDGSHVVEVTIVDPVGNSQTKTLTLVIDTETTVSVAEPDGPVTGLGGTGEPGATVTVTIGGRVVTTVVAPDGTWSVDFPAELDPGIYEAHVSITDPAGNAIDTVVTFEVAAVAQEAGSPPVGSLAFTGSDARRLVIAALLLGSLGGLMTLVSRRHENDEHEVVG